MPSDEQLDALVDLINEEEVASKVFARLLQSPQDALTEKSVADIATTVVDEFDERFEQIGRKSEPLDDVLLDFRARKLQEVSSERQYRRKFEYLQTYLVNVLGRASTSDLTSKDIEGYRPWRKHESLNRDQPLATATLQDDLYLYREFVRYMIEHRMVPARFEHHVRIPRLNSAANEGVDPKKLTPNRARAILAHLRKFNRADVEHIVFELMCEAGPRKSDLHALDVEDFDDGEEPALNFRHREATPLKNDQNSDRSISLFGETPDIVRDYLAVIRAPTTDEHGRRPLLTKGDGRLGKSTIKKIAYKWTRPCQVGKECPHDRDPETCGAAQSNNQAYKCPSSRVPHHVRKGYITAKRDAGVPIDAISQRCDVSPRVLEKHYDLPNFEQARERHDDDFRNTGDDSQSGFSHS